MFLRLLASNGLLGIGLLVCLGCGSDPPKIVSTPTAAEQHFALKVRPLLEAKCFACHGTDPEEVQGGFDLTTRERLIQGGESGGPAVVVGDPNQGLLIEAVHRTSLEMPPKEADRLTDEQIAVLERWIAEGLPWPDEALQAELRREAWEVEANDEGVLVKTSGGLVDDWTYRRYQPEDLWAYQPIQKSEIEDSARNPIDVLIDQRLAAAGLEPAPTAEPRTLIRRVTFDVIGLPPTPEQVEEFLEAWNADTDSAWVALVDRLLSSPHYGEQAARHWLDVVRYADSGGFANDWQRPTAWRYRDYVVRSFNNDKPYDQFVREQLAGDEINAHEPEMQVAVGFLRMGPWEHSTMSVPTVSRQQFLDDVTDAVGQVFLAHPLQCARCHDHKFDPIPTRDYYALQAIFATTQVADVDAPWLAEENTAGMTEDQQALDRKQQWNEQVCEQFERKIVEAEKAWFRERDLPYESRDQAIKQGASPDQIPEFRVGLTPNDLGTNRTARKWRRRFKLEQLRYQPFALGVYNGKTNLPNAINKPLPVPAEPMGKGDFDQSAILVGGDPFSPGDAVEPGVLSAVSVGYVPKITNQHVGRRLALAEWLVEPSHPLTARVMVNRLWQSHFGRGIVETPNNFGATGKKPTHPEVLDFLAATFIERGWSIKDVRRMILLSQTYRRSSEYADYSSLERLDPERQLYAVFRPRRLAAEELRDSMLAVSGELNPTMGGIPVRPDRNLEAALQPRLVMGTFAPAYVPNAKPERRNRRTIYAQKLRGLRDPFLEVFNRPSPDIACELRDQSNVTPQVFSLLNGQESIERATALASRICEATETDEAAVQRLFELAYARPPTSGEASEAILHWQQMQATEAGIEYARASYPAEVVRRANEENSGQVFEFVEKLFEYEDYQPDLQPQDVDLRTRAFADVCLMVLNSNEFVYVY